MKCSYSPSGGGDELREGVPGEEEDGDVVVPVQEDELVLPEHDEDGVDQLGRLRQRERPHPEAEVVVVAGVVAAAHRLLEAKIAVRVEHLGPDTNRSQDRKYCQSQIP